MAGFHALVELRPLLQQVEAGQGRRAAEGVGGEAVAVEEGEGGVGAHKPQEQPLEQPFVQPFEQPEEQPELRGEY